MNDNDVIHISLCMGSSCFVRGNNTILETLERVIADSGWQDRVRLSGLRCQDRCADGPNILVDGVLHQGLDAGALLDLLAARLGIDPASAEFSAIRRYHTRRF